jgi:hypothetical protein
MSRSGLQTLTNTKISILATSTAVLVANTAREFIALTNDSDETMYVSFNGENQTNPAVLNEGIPLYVGETITFESPVIPFGPVYAICASGTKNMTVSEGA